MYLNLCLIKYLNLMDTLKKMKELNSINQLMFFVVVVCLFFPFMMLDFAVFG